MPKLTPDALYEAISDLCVAQGTHAVLASVARLIRDWADDPLLPPSPAQATRARGLALATDALATLAHDLLKEDDDDET